MADHEIMTLEEVAQFLRVSERTVYDWAQKGDIPGGKLGVSWRFKRQDVEQWVDQRLGKGDSSDTTSPLSLEKFIRPERVLLLKGTTKAEALRELIACMHSASEVKKPEALTDAVFHREALMSTGIGLGVAIPHVRLSSVTDIVMAVGVSRDGIADYETLDAQPVHVVFLIAAGEKQHGEYLRLLSGISRRIKDESFRKSLLEVSTPESLFEVLTQEG